MLNQVNIMGRVCAKPELKYTQSGLPVTNLRLAVDRNYLTNEERAPTSLPWLPGGARPSSSRATSRRAR